MATRASTADVKAILQFTPTKTDLQPFIDAANQIVNDVVVSQGFTADKLKIIETWLAAHFVAVGDRAYYQGLVVMETIGEQQTQYSQVPPIPFGNTPYGAQAMLLDTSGQLAWLSNWIAKGKRPKASVAWLGTAPCRVDPARPWLFQDLYTG